MKKDVFAKFNTTGFVEMTDDELYDVGGGWSWYSSWNILALVAATLWVC